MNPREIAETLEIPWYKIVEWDKDPETLRELLQLALNKGIQCGQFKLSEDYTKAFREYSALTIIN